VFLAIRFCSSSVLCAEIGSLVNSAHPGRIGKRKWGDTGCSHFWVLRGQFGPFFIGPSEQKCSAFRAHGERYCE
jgi:hypothetical protein